MDVYRFETQASELVLIVLRFSTRHIFIFWLKYYCELATIDMNYAAGKCQDNAMVVRRCIGFT